MQQITCTFVLFAVALPRSEAHGYIYEPISMQDLTYRLRYEADWQPGMPESRRWEPGNARLAPGQSPEQPGASCGIGYQGESADPLYAEGLQTWQKWYVAGGLPVPSISPGAEVEVRANLNADHGGQAWFEIACSDKIAENIQWILLERAPSDRGHHYMPSNPRIYAWAFGDVSTDLGRSSVVTARWLVPASFSCPSGQAVGRWVWKVANTCNDIDNLGINTERFSMDEYRAVVNRFKQGQNVQGKCTSSPEQFLSCFVFRVSSDSNPTQQTTASTTRSATVPVLPTTIATTTTTTSTLAASTPWPVVCAPIGDCSPLAWCDQEDYVQWCAQEAVAGNCPNVFCQRVDPVPTAPLPISATTPAPTPAPTPVPSPSGQCPNAANNQCGGNGFSGATCCPDGHYCKVVSDYWSQCYSCQYFPDSACGTSLLSARVSRRHRFLGTALIQDGSAVGLEKKVIKLDELRNGEL